jgi:hypothetical protein
VIAMLRTDGGGHAGDDAPHKTPDMPIEAERERPAPPPAPKDEAAPQPKPKTPDSGFSSFES